MDKPLPPVPVLHSISEGVSIVFYISIHNSLFSSLSTLYSSTGSESDSHSNNAVGVLLREHHVTYGGQARLNVVGYYEEGSVVGALTNTFSNLYYSTLEIPAALGRNRVESNLNPAALTWSALVL